MSYEAKVIMDSITARGHRLTTMQITFPRIILAEFNTHRMFSRNSASSRAIPVEKRIASINFDPFVPEAYGRNQKGMQAADDLSGTDDLRARDVWFGAMGSAVQSAAALAAIGVHKHWANRLIETYAWQTVVVSSTEWTNYDALRDHKAAAPEIQRVTRMMGQARAESKPVLLTVGSWHLPYVSTPDGSIPMADAMVASRFASTLGIKTSVVLRMMSTGRCAAVSFNRQETTEAEKAVDIYQRLKASGHMSPFEHPARPMTQFEYENLFNQPELEWTGEGHSDGWKEVGRTHYCGNFQGWVQDRKMIPGEADFSKVSEA